MPDYFANSKPTPTDNQTIKSTPRTLYANRNRAAVNLRRFGWDGTKETQQEYVDLVEALEPLTGMKVVVDERLEPGSMVMIGADGKGFRVRCRKDGGTGELVVDQVTPVEVVRKEPAAE